MFCNISTKRDRMILNLYSPNTISHDKIFIFIVQNIWKYFHILFIFKNLEIFFSHNSIMQMAAPMICFEKNELYSLDLLNIHSMLFITCVWSKWSNIADICFQIIVMFYEVCFLNWCLAFHFSLHELPHKRWNLKMKSK